MQIPVIPLENPTHLARELDAFHPGLDGWYFRGQADESWELIPSVWRSNKFALNFRSEMQDEIISKLKTTIEQTLKTNNVESIDVDIALQWAINVKAENCLLAKFYYEANNAGLSVADRPLQLCKTHNQSFWMADHLREIGNVFNFYAHRANHKSHRIAGPLMFDGTLPQHYGLPTRYLDWTTNPRIAAFFAGYEYLKFTAEKREKIRKIAIYAIKESNIKHGPVQILDHHARHKNQFLHAQCGLFTRTHGDFYYLENGKWPAIEDFYAVYSNEFFEVKKYTLAVEHLSHLMQALQRQNISISTMMPNYNFVAEQIKTFCC